MKLQDLMTADVITISPDAPVKEAARRMIEAGVSGLLVTDKAGMLVGVITEADFLKQEAGRRANKRARLLRLFTDEHGVPDESRTVGDVMTRHLITLGPESDHSEAARVMEREGVKRIPVVDDRGELLGLVSRADILRAFARPDTDIIDELEQRVMRQVLWINSNQVSVRCEDGNLSLSGQLETRSDCDLLVEFARRIDGVASVESHLSFKIDNTKVSLMPPRPGFPPTSGW